MRRRFPRLGFLAMGAAFLLSGVLAGRCLGGDLQLEARLVWGTDEPKPDDPRLTEVDAKLKASLSGVFKWKHYYEVRRKTFEVVPSAVSKVEMSPRCRIEVSSMGKFWLEVKLYGRKQKDAPEKLVVHRKQEIQKGELLVLAGDDINDTAWFVVLRRPKD